MGMKIFVKKSHLSGVVFALIPYVVCVGVVTLGALRFKSISIYEVVFVVLATFIAIPLCVRLGSLGLYINGDVIVVKKVFTTRKISARDIVAIKILQSYYSLGHVDQPIVDKKGMPYYTAFLLSSVTGEVCRFSSADTRFIRMYHQHIICSVVSDPDAIGYLKMLNPHIQII